METGTTIPDDLIVEQPQFKPIISVKEARKLMGKELSEQFDDEDVMGLVRLMSYLAQGLLEHVSVPQITKVEI